MKILLVKVFIVCKYMFDSLTKILKLLILTIVMLSSNCVFAQSYHTTSKKAIRCFEKAKQELYDTDYSEDSYDVILSHINDALSHDSDFADALLLKAELYVQFSKDSLAIESYEHLFNIDSSAFPKSAISLSKLYDKYFQFDKSVKLLDWYLSLDDQKEIHLEMAEQQLSLVKFRKSLVENNVTYNPKNIGDVINSSDDEYVNQYCVNEEKLVFTNRHLNECILVEDVYYSSKIDSVFLPPLQLLKNIDSYGDIGAAHISSDAREIYFSGCGWENALGACDIYCVEFKNGDWSEPINIKSVNTSDWESQPCLSYDGKELYFVRGSKKSGTSDIYVSLKSEDGSWMKPSRLNSNINTQGNEMSPFIHHDGRTLYFSSDGHWGMGGYDLFVSHRDANGEWSEAVNLGYPLNTSKNEINIVISNDAKKAFISADKTGGLGGYDIYEFELDERFRPEAVEIVRPSDEKYYADMLEKQESVDLKNIYFEFDSAELKAESESGINMICNFLSSNPDKSILLVGHTDDVGNEEYNIILSERRAENIKQALIDKGISPDRIKTKGCGSAQPLFPNNFDDELKKLNRRVSMSLID